MGGDDRGKYSLIRMAPCCSSSRARLVLWHTKPGQAALTTALASSHSRPNSTRQNAGLLGREQLSILTRGTT